MNRLTLARSGRILVLSLSAILLPLAVEAQQGVSVSPTSVSVQASVGTNAPTQTVQVKRRGKPTAPAPWTVVQASANWLTVSPTSGVNDGTLTLTFTTSALSAGQYQTSFQVESSGSPRTVTVQATIVGTTPPPLTVTCPANMSVASPDGSGVVVTYSLSTSGGVAPVTVTGSPASGSRFPLGATAVQVSAASSDGQTAGCTFTVTVTYSPSPPSGDWTFCAWEYGFCSFTGTRNVRYGVGSTYATRTLTDGTPCTNEVFGDPVVGATKHCEYSPEITTQPPPTSARGPQPTITCPAGSFDLQPGTSIPTLQSLIDANPGATTFCFKVGIHSLDRSIIPKSGNTFVGEYGAILDGTGWTTTNDIDAAFRAYNQDIDHVTIRNLVIRNLRRGIQGLGTASDHWTIEYNEVGPNYSGIVFPSNSIVRNNYIHNNSFGGYTGINAHFSILENNEIAVNGWEQKIALSTDVTFRNNFVHHNSGAGIWYDSDNTGAIVEGNRVEDNGWIGIFYEISTDGVIRNNTIRRNGEAGVFLGTSKNTEIHNNTLENNFRAITYFVNCAAVGGGAIGWDLSNNTAHDNTITVGTQSGALASVFSYYSSCSAAQVEPYRNGSMNLTFSNNTYDVPSPATGQYWFWAGLNSWSGWQALGHDTTGTAQ